MKEKLELYKKISTNMLGVLKKHEYDKFDELLDSRQCIINDLIYNNQIEEFRKLYDKEEIEKIDKEMKSLLDISIEETKSEIKEYRVKIQGNKSYSNIKNEKFNIFSKKI